MIIVVAVTTVRRGLPSHVELDAVASGLRETSYAKAEDVKSISTERAVHRIGRAPFDAQQQLGVVLRMLLEL